MVASSSLGQVNNHYPLGQVTEQHCPLCPARSTWRNACTHGPALLAFAMPAACPRIIGIGISAGASVSGSTIVI
eukprot:9640842-Lingulodinium_polyedra.AAC.1